jgi:hypothetical protein
VRRATDEGRQTDVTYDMSWLGYELPKVDKYDHALDHDRLTLASFYLKLPSTTPESCSSPKSPAFRSCQAVHADWLAILWRQRIKRLTKNTMQVNTRSASDS